MDNAQMLRSKIIKTRRNIRDSVFKALMREGDNLRNIYLSLHPEDVAVKKEELCIIESEPVFIGGTIHDCCFTVRGEKVIFIEVQSTSCRMLPYRMGRYWGDSLVNLNPLYEERQYSTNGVDMPSVEFYTIYVGEKSDNVPQYLVFENGKGKERPYLYISIDVKTEYNTSGIIYEYCVFSRIYMENMKVYGDDKEKVIKETLRACLEMGILKEFLMKHEGEVRKIMSENNEYYFEKYLDGYGRDREEKGRAEEAAIAKDKFRSFLKNKGYSSSEIEEAVKEYNAM